MRAPLLAVPLALQIFDLMPLAHCPLLAPPKGGTGNGQEACKSNICKACKASQTKEGFDAFSTHKSSICTKGKGIRKVVKSEALFSMQMGLTHICPILATPAHRRGKRNKGRTKNGFVKGASALNQSFFLL